MNVIVTNKQKEIIDNANIDAIKDFNGLFNVDDLINKVKNYFFSKLILDATSIVNFSSKEVLEKLASSIGSDRLVILLPTEVEPPQEFINLLVSLKIFNFSTNINDIVKFINVPNTYENVVGITDTNQTDYYVDNSIKANEEFNDNIPFNGTSNSLFNPIITDVSSTADKLQNDDVNNFSLQSNSVGDYQNFNNSVNMYPNNIFNQQNNGFVNNMPNMNGNPNTFNNLNNTFNNNDNIYNSNPVINNDVVNNQFGNTGFVNPNNYSNSNMNSYVNENVVNNNAFTTESSNSNVNNDNNFYGNFQKNSQSFVLGFKNLTVHAGSTTLIYLLMKAAREKLKLRVNAVEINKNDFKYFNDEDMISATTDSFVNIINSSNANLILVDLNDYNGNYEIFNDVVYLVEPSVIRLNKLMMDNRFAFRENSSHKMMLNMSLLNNNEVNALSKEAGINFMMNIPPLNDRISNDIIMKILTFFGFK